MILLYTHRYTHIHNRVVLYGAVTRTGPCRAYSDLCVAAICRQYQIHLTLAPGNLRNVVYFAFNNDRIGRSLFRAGL